MFGDISRRTFVNSSLKLSAASMAMLAVPGCGLSSKRNPWTYDANFDEYTRYDAVDLARMVRKGDADPKELLDIAIAHTERFNPHYNFIATPLYDYARDKLAQGTPRGQMGGVPFLLKDLSIHLKGTRLTSGSVLYRDYVSSFSSTLAQRYEDAGLIIYGKTTSPEMGASITTESRLFGPTRNPWDPRLSPGGSSGGSAVAVAIGALPVAHASDGGGSIRIPASACGIFGMKPSRGRIPYGPHVVEGAGGLSVMHVVSRSVRDCAAMLDISHGPEVTGMYTAPPPERPYLEEVTRSPGKLKIAVMTGEGSGFSVSQDALDAVAHARALCKDLGHTLTEVPWPSHIDSKAAGDAMGVLMGANGLTSIEDFERQRGRTVNRRELTAVNWWQINNMRGLSATDYLRARRGLLGVIRTIQEHYEGYDVVLSPTMAVLPPLLNTVDTTKGIENMAEMMAPYAMYTATYNMTGHPAMSVPLYWNADNIPVGVMFAATQHFAEDVLYRLAGQLEREQPWSDKRPTLSLG